jgi:hypothetical protein
MKNIHVLPTDKPSNGYILGKCIKELSDVKIGQFIKTYYLMFDKEYFQPYHIYITSDEEIKEGDWYFNKKQKKPFKCVSKDNGMIRPNHHHIFNCKKIILTTDPELIKDGIQSIDDEFLEWFVKNPSCEFVFISKNSHTAIEEISYEGDFQNVDYNFYKIIIPKEEPKQETTLEEAAQRYSDNWEEITGLDYEEQYPDFVNKLDFINGAKWQQEQYEILFDEYHEYTVDCIEVELKRPLPLQKWFEQFKKK